MRKSVTTTLYKLGSLELRRKLCAMPDAFILLNFKTMRDETFLGIFFQLMPLNVAEANAHSVGWLVPGKPAGIDCKLFQKSHNCSV